MQVKMSGGLNSKWTGSYDEGGWQEPTTTLVGELNGAHCYISLRIMNTHLFNMWVCPEYY